MHTHTHTHTQAHYARQRRAMHLAAEKHLVGLASWDLPKAGMFVLFKVRPYVCGVCVLFMVCGPVDRV